MRLIIWALWFSFVAGSTPAREPHSTRPYVQTAMKLMGLCDWWLAWGDELREPVFNVQDWQWDHTCRGYHAADI